MGNIILARILATSQQSPNRPCFDDPTSADGGLTYGELESQSTRLAGYLARHFQRTQPILVYGGLTKDMLVAFIACQKAGHPYVPVDDQTPESRLNLIYTEAKPACTLAFAPWPLSQENLLTGADVARIVTEKGTETRLRAVTGAELLYIIFTSGTTGKPKGVQISYANVMSFCQWLLSDFSLPKEQRFLCQAPFSFDLSVMDLYPALLSGGALVPVPKEIADDLAGLFALIPTLFLNVWVSTPSMVEICLVNASFNEAALPSLTHFLFCGEELPHSVAKKLLARFPRAQIFNTYGPTEATVAITSIQITPEVLAQHERLPLGKVKEDTEVVILDEHQQVLAGNHPGEIVILGPAVSSGYFNDPVKSKEAFFEYAGKPAYRTGDRGYFDQGLLFYQGRLDFQIKWHGYRMELGDIDYHLQSLKEVRSVCVVPKYKNHKVQQLVAYVVLHDGLPVEARVTARALKAQLEGHLMSYMVPQKFVFVTELPLSANGKINRKQLIAEVNP